MSLAVLFHILRAQHISDINISIRSLRLCCWITKSIVVFSVRCVLEIWCGWVWVAGWSFSLQHGHYSNPAAPNLQNTTNREHNNRRGNQQQSRKLLMMDILMSEICWAHKKWNKIPSDIKLVLYSATITMMHGPINIMSWTSVFVCDIGCDSTYRETVTASFRNLRFQILMTVYPFHPDHIFSSRISFVNSIGKKHFKFYF